MLILVKLFLEAVIKRKPNSWDFRSFFIDQVHKTSYAEYCKLNQIEVFLHNTE